MSTSSPKPSPLSTTAAFKNLAAAIDRSVPADRAADLLVDYRATVRAEAETEVRAAIAEDFIRQGKASDSLNWGQAVSIARDGLCSCSGGTKPCDMGGAL